jgi:hypothetical protein
VKRPLAHALRVLALGTALGVLLWLCWLALGALP